jgi:hypothetical protein
VRVVNFHCEIEPANLLQYEGAPQDISDHHEMKLGLPNYAVIMSVSKYSSCIRTNNKLNSLQNHDTAQN